MSTFFRILPVTLAVLCATATAQAQTASSSTAGRADRSSMAPYTQDGYVGLSGGRSQFDLNSGPIGFRSDSSDSVVKLTTGGFFHPNMGVEFGYLDVGKAQRLGGNTKAQGFNLSLVGRAPLTEQFDLFGKVGTTYGRTRTSGVLGTGVKTGKEDGFGLSYGLGARWAFTPQWAAVVEWENHKFKFSDGDADVKLTTVGLQYRF